MKNKFKLLTAFLLFIFYSLLFHNTCFSQYIMDLKVNDDTTTKLQNNPAISTDTKGNFIIAWEDSRDSASGNQIFCQKYSFSGQEIGINFKISETTGINPCIAYRKDKSFVLVYSYSSTRIKMRIFDSLGIPNSPVITVNDTINLYIAREYMSLSVDSLGYIYVTMYYSKYNAYNYPDIYLQKFEPNGNKIGNNEKVNDDTVYNIMQSKPVITVRRDRSFIIAWRDHRPNTGGGAGDIYMQMYGQNGQKIGVNMIVNDDNNPVNVDQDRPSISSDSIGNFTIVWDDNRLTEIYYQPFAQNYNLNGVKIGVNYRVDQGISFNKIKSKVSKGSDGKFIIGWVDPAYNTSTPFARRYNNDYSPIGNQFPIPKQALNFYKNPFDFKIYGDKIITTWADYREGNGDIYANIISFQNPDSVINNVSKINDNKPRDFKLFQNYPNPFNPITKIKFDIPAKTVGQTFLSVYDILGKEVATLVNESALGGQPGTYSVDFDATNFPSGVYFYKLVAGDFVCVKRMVLIK